MTNRPSIEQIFLTPINQSLSDLALITDTQYLEPLASNSLNRKFSGIVEKGIFRGFECEVVGDLSIKVHSENHKFGSALVEREDYVLTVRQQKSVIVDVPIAPEDKQYHIVLEAFYQHGVVTKQIDSSSEIEAASIKLIAVGQEEDHQLILVTVNVPKNSTFITADNLDFDFRSIAGLDLDVHLKKYNPHNITKVTVQLEKVNNWTATSEITLNDPQLYATARGLFRLNEKINENLSLKSVHHHQYLAIGGERDLALPWIVQDVDSLTIQGIRQTKNKAWELNHETNSVRLAESLYKNDEVIITLGNPSIDAEILLKELQNKIEELQHALENKNEANQPVSLTVFNDIISSPTDELLIPLSLSDKTVKIVFVDGVQQAEYSAYHVNYSLNMIRFASELPIDTQVSLVATEKDAAITTVNQKLTVDTDQIVIPSDLIGKTIKLVFVDGAQQTSNLAYFIDIKSNSIQFASKLNKGTTITIIS